MEAVNVIFALLAGILLKKEIQLVECHAEVQKVYTNGFGIVYRLSFH